MEDEYDILYYSKFIYEIDDLKQLKISDITKEQLIEEANQIIKVLIYKFEHTSETNKVMGKLSTQ